MDAYIDNLNSRTLTCQISLMIYRETHHVSWIMRWKWPVILNLRLSENGLPYKLAANEGVIKEVLNSYRDDSDTVFLCLSHDLRPNILKV